MKRIYAIVLILLFAVANARVIDARGEIVRKEINAADIRALDVRTQFDVYLSQGKQEAFILETYKSILPHVETKQSKEQLMVRLDRMVTRINWMGRERILKLYVTVRDIEKMDLSGACDLYMLSALNVGDFQLNASGASDLHFMPVKGNSVRIFCSGASDIADGDFDVQRFYLNTSGASDADLRIRSEESEFITSGASDIDLEISGGKLKINASGATDFAVAGEVDNLDARIGGASTLKADGLHARVADVNVSGNSTCHLYVLESLKANSSGISSIYYRGNPPKTSFSSSGMASIKSK